MEDHAIFITEEDDGAQDSASPPHSPQRDTSTSIRFGDVYSHVKSSDFTFDSAPPIAASAVAPVSTNTKASAKNTVYATADSVLLELEVLELEVPELEPTSAPELGAVTSHQS
jgi:hypothetical protein